MPLCLSKEWIQEADAALRASGLRMSDGERLVVEQQVGEVAYHMAFEADGASAHSRAATDPTSCSARTGALRWPLPSEGCRRKKQC